MAPTDFTKVVSAWLLTAEGIEAMAELAAEEEGEEVPERRKRKSPEHREEFKNIDYTKTNWGKMIRNPLVKDPNSRFGKLFRRRFRVPFQLFEFLVQLCTDHNIFCVKDLHKVKIPVEIKLLCCLRVLGRDDCFDAIEEMSDVPEKTVYQFFKVFIVRFPECLKSETIKVPAEGEELDRVMHVYAKMGFPGAVGSVDATHVRWHMCPVDFRHLATGKEKYPSIVFQVTQCYYAVNYFSRDIILNLIIHCFSFLVRCGPYKEDTAHHPWFLRGDKRHDNNTI